MSKAWSSDHSPGPIVAMQNAATAIDAQYSQPWFGLKMKKPTFQWATMIATSMMPIIPAAASGVSRPAAMRTPAPISVLGRDACLPRRPAHPDAAEPPGGAGQPAAAEHLVVAVVGEEQAEDQPQHEQREVELVHGRSGYRPPRARPETQARPPPGDAGRTVGRGRRRHDRSDQRGHADQGVPAAARAAAPPQAACSSSPSPGPRCTPRARCSPRSSSR